MRYLDTVVIGLLLMIGIYNNVGTVSKEKNKGIYYDDVKYTDNVNFHKVKDIQLDYEAELSTPGDYYEISFDVVNKTGTDMRIGNLIYPKDDDYLKYELTYEDGNKVKKGDIIQKGQEKRIVYKVKYENNILEDSYEFDSSFSINYEQAL